VIARAASAHRSGFDRGADSRAGDHLGPAPKVMGRDQVKREPVRLIEDVEFDLGLALKAPL
jgi:hypothetical protein